MFGEMKLLAMSFFKMAHNGWAMCSSGFETQNFKYRMNYDSRTNVRERTNTAIAYSRC